MGLRLGQSFERRYHVDEAGRRVEKGAPDAIEILLMVERPSRKTKMRAAILARQHGNGKGELTAAAMATVQSGVYASSIRHVHGLEDGEGNPLPEELTPENIDALPTWIVDDIEEWSSQFAKRELEEQGESEAPRDS